MKQSPRFLLRFGAVFTVGLLLGTALPSLGATLLGSSQFSDVQPGAYFDAAIGRLASQGIVKGFEGKFRPEQFVTRADVAVMIDRAINGTDGASASSRARASSSMSSAASTTPTAAGSLRFTTEGFSVAKGSKKASLVVIRSGGTKGDVKVDYAFGGGSAIVGTDYQALSGTISFADGESSKTINVTLMRQEDSPQRTLDVMLSNPTNGAVLGSPNKATLTLLGVASNAGSSSSATSAPTSGAGLLSFSANTYAVLEDGGAISITVVRKEGSTGQVTVNYATSNGTATSGTNYSSTQGTLTFAAGETSKTFSVQVTNSTEITGNKTVNLTLSGVAGGAAIGSPGTAVLTIIDKEAVGGTGSGTVQFPTSTYTVTESAGSVVVTVARQQSPAGTVSVNYTTSDSSATAGSDYTATSGTLTFAPGEMTKTFSVPIIKDSTTESEEIINLTLSGLSGPATLGSQSTATIKIQ